MKPITAFERRRRPKPACRRPHSTNRPRPQGQRRRHRPTGPRRTDERLRSSPRYARMVDLGFRAMALRITSNPSRAVGPIFRARPANGAGRPDIRASTRTTFPFLSPAIREARPSTRFCPRSTALRWRRSRPRNESDTTSRVLKSFYPSLNTTNVCMLPIEIGCEKIWKMHPDLEAKSASPSRVSSFRGLPQRANSDRSTMMMKINSAFPA